MKAAGCGAAVLLCCASGCAGTPTQAVVTVEVEQALWEDLSTIVVSSVDERGTPHGHSASFLTRGADAVGNSFSFGVVPADGNTLRLHINGYSEDALIIAQHLTLALGSGRVSPLPVLLREACGRSVCGPTPSCEELVLLNGAFSCVPDPTCSDTDEPECGGPVPHPESCDCDMTNVEWAQCNDGNCSIRCELGYDDCNSDHENDGCEVEKDTDADHCGGCTGENRRCPFGVCKASRCKTDFEGYIDSTQEIRWPGNRMIGMMIDIARDGVASGLGIRLESGAGKPNAHFRLGLYHSASGPAFTPGEIIDATAEMTVEGLGSPDTGIVSTYDGLEMPIYRGHEMHAGDRYWVFFIASDEVYLASRPVNTSWRQSQADVPYASLSEMPRSPSAPKQLEWQHERPQGDLYIVTTPRP